MKLQDIFFVAVLLIVIYKGGKYAWLSGMASLILSGVLFGMDNLFTSQRLSWYALGFFSVAVVHNLYEIIFEARKKS